MCFRERRRCFACLGVIVLPGAHPIHSCASPPLPPYPPLQICITLQLEQQPGVLP